MQRTLPVKQDHPVLGAVQIPAQKQSLFTLVWQLYMLKAFHDQGGFNIGSNSGGVGRTSQRCQRWDCTHRD